MKRFIIEWCKTMVKCLAILFYIAIFMGGIYILNDGTLKGFIYIGLWVLFVAVTTITTAPYLKF